MFSGCNSPLPSRNTRPLVFLSRSWVLTASRSALANPLPPPPTPPPPRPTAPAEPDFGSDVFEDATITFYDSADCSNATDTEAYTTAELYEFYGVEDGTSCSPSGLFEFNTVIQCSGGSPAAVYYEVP